MNNRTILEHLTTIRNTVLDLGEDEAQYVGFDYDSAMTAIDALIDHFSSERNESCTN